MAGRSSRPSKNFDPALAAPGAATQREVRAVALALEAVLLAALAAIALHAGHWAQVTGVGVAAPVLAKVEAGVNVGAEVTLIVLICTAIARLALALWGLRRPAVEAHAAANGA